MKVTVISTICPGTNIHKRGIMFPEPGIIDRSGGEMGIQCKTSDGLLVMRAASCKANERSQRGRPRNTSECGG
jgi:hypothetical protein